MADSTTCAGNGRGAGGCWKSCRSLTKLKRRSPSGSCSKTLPVDGRKAMYHWVLCKAIAGFDDFRPSSAEMENMASTGGMTVQQVRGWFTNNRRRFMNQSALSLRYDAAHQLYRLYRFHHHQLHCEPATTTTNVDEEHDNASSSDDERAQTAADLGTATSPAAGRSNGVVTPIVTTQQQQQRARHQPDHVLRFAAGLEGRDCSLDNEMSSEYVPQSRTRSHWEALVDVAATYSDELAHTNSFCTD